MCFEPWGAARARLGRRVAARRAAAVEKSIVPSCKGGGIEDHNGAPEWEYDVGDADRWPKVVLRVADLIVPYV